MTITAASPWTEAPPPTAAPPSTAASQVAAAPSHEEDPPGSRAGRLRTSGVPCRRPAAEPLKATTRSVPAIDLAAGAAATGNPRPGPGPGGAAVLATDFAAARSTADESGICGNAPEPLADPTHLCCAIVRSAVEALRGERTVHQLVRWLAPPLYHSLSRRTALSRPSATDDRIAPPVSVLRARTVRLGPGAAETTVIVQDDDRVRAAAVRMETHRGAWRVVAMEIG